MKSVEKLLANYPDVEIVKVEQELDQATFDAQKAKHEARNSEGGAIGTIWFDDSTFILTKRSGLHVGWALIGGTVENEESFDDAFLREVEEEAGVKAKIERVVLLERKTFISPSDERLSMDVALVEAVALDGQKVLETKEAEQEGLIVKTFNTNSIPSEMILADREKLQLLVESRKV